MATFARPIPSGSIFSLQSFPQRLSRHGRENAIPFARPNSSCALCAPLAAYRTCSSAPPHLYSISRTAWIFTRLRICPSTILPSSRACLSIDGKLPPPNPLALFHSEILNDKGSLCVTTSFPRVQVRGSRELRRGDSGRFADHISTYTECLTFSDWILEMVCKAIHEEVRVPLARAAHSLPSSP